MHVPEWLATIFDMIIDNKDYESDLEDELIEICVNLKAKALFKCKTPQRILSNINIATKHPKLIAAAKPFLLALPTSYMVEAGFGSMNTILTKQRNKLKTHNCGDLKPNFQPNVNNLAAAHQAHPSH